MPKPGLGWPTGQLLIVFVALNFLGNRHFSQKLFCRAESSKLLYFYYQKSCDVSKITLTDQRMLAFHHDFRLSEFVVRQQSLGTKFLERYSSLCVVMHLPNTYP